MQFSLSNYNLVVNEVIFRIRSTSSAGVVIWADALECLFVFSLVLAIVGSIVAGE